MQPALQAWLGGQPTPLLAELKETDMGRIYPWETRSGQTKITHERDHAPDLWLQDRCPSPVYPGEKRELQKHVSAGWI